MYPIDYFKLFYVQKNDDLLDAINEVDTDSREKGRYLIRKTKTE